MIIDQLPLPFAAMLFARTIRRKRDIASSKAIARFTMIGYIIKSNGEEYLIKQCMVNRNSIVPILNI